MSGAITFCRKARIFKNISRTMTAMQEQMVSISNENVLWIMVLMSSPNISQMIDNFVRVRRKIKENLKKIKENSFLEVFIILPLGSQLFQ
jgi:hypothetical protein